MNRDEAVATIVLGIFAFILISAVWAWINWVF